MNMCKQMLVSMVVILLTSSSLFGVGVALSYSGSRSPLYMQLGESKTVRFNVQNYVTNNTYIVTQTIITNTGGFASLPDGAEFIQFLLHGNEAIDTFAEFYIPISSLPGSYPFSSQFHFTPEVSGGGIGLGTSIIVGFDVNVTPEPATLLLFGLGGILLRRRR